MAIVINGSGTVTGISVGGLPDGIVDSGTLATNSVDSAELIDGAVDAAHLASGAGGITEIDKWVLTVSKTDASVVSANLERAGTSSGFVSLKGTGMTQSSGVFSFPSTGYWMVTVNATFYVVIGDNIALYIDVTDDNSNWETNLVSTWQANRGAAGGEATTGSSVSEIVKVEDVSLDKVRFDLDSVAVGSSLTGTTAGQGTTFDFIKLGGL
jgi:hypothetical protein